MIDDNTYLHLREDSDRPPVTAETTITTFEKIIFALLMVGLLVFVYGAMRVVWPIASAFFTLWRNQQ